MQTCARSHHDSAGMGDVTSKPTAGCDMHAKQAHRKIPSFKLQLHSQTLLPHCMAMCKIILPPHHYITWPHAQAACKHQ
jgi:hypothetical protein